MREREAPPERAIVLSSGGLDSATVLAMARADGFSPLPVTFRYGQTHAIEVEFARRAAARLGIEEHLVLDLPLRQLGGSALLGDGPIPAEPPGGPRPGVIPPTYVPARNLVLLSVAIAVAEPRRIRDIYIGVNHLDSSGYPDCRPEFLSALAAAVNLGTREGVEHAEPWFRIRAPLVALRKSEIIRRGVSLGVDYSLTVSCYQPDGAGRACGACEACGLRRRGFAEAGVADPTAYRN